MTRRARIRASAEPPPPPPTPVEVIRPDPAAWKVALEAADGDPRRLRVIDAHTIEVRNN